MYWGILFDIACIYGSNYLGQVQGYAQAKQDMKAEMLESKIYDIESKINNIKKTQNHDRYNNKKEMNVLRKKLGL